MKQDGVQNRIKLIIALLVAALALTLCQPVKPRKSAAISTPTDVATLQNFTGAPVDVSAMCTLTGSGAETSVSRDSFVRITWGWSASTAQQVQAYIDAQMTTVTLDGKDITTAQRGNILSFNQKYAVFWTADIGTLSPGAHVITYHGAWKKKIEDGQQTYGPGGTVIELSDICQVLVK